LLSLVGVVGLVGELVSLGWHRRAVRYLSVAVSVALILVLGSVSYGRAASFRDDFAFFQQWKATDPEFDFVGTHTKIGMLQLRRGQYLLAEAHARAAVSANLNAIAPRIALGEALLGQGKLDDAQRQFDLILSYDRQYPDALAGSAEVLATRGDWQAAAQLYRAALQKEPISAEAAQRYAWLLATCPDERMRNGDLALRWAMVVFNAGRQEDVRVLQTLAAAYAELGDFERAIHWQSQVIGRSGADEELTRRRLAEYRAGKPYRTSSPITARPRGE
jgi:tetratricopeptide (TPR) repeat protein